MLSVVPLVELGVGRRSDIHRRDEQPLRISGRDPVARMLAYTYSIVCAPAATPREIIDALYRATEQIIKDQTFQNESRDLGFESVDSSPEKASRFIKEELARWAPIIKATGAKLE